MIGRGAADDKGQLHLHLRAAAALLATRGRCRVNVRFVFEGEEESGSVDLERWLEANRDRLTADAVVISDTGFFEGNLPAITLGAARPDLPPDRRHRPADRPPLGRLRRQRPEPGERPRPILAALKDADGRVNVPGFYDEVGADERGARRSGCAAVRRGGVSATVGVPRSGRTRLPDARAARRPPDARRQRPLGRLPGRGREDDHPGPRPRQGQRRLVPGPGSGETLSSASRPRSSRAAGRDGRRRASAAAGRRLTPIDHPVDAAAAGPRGDVRRRAVLHPRGGSIPVAAMFETILGLPVVLLGFTHPDEHAHAPNESMVLANYETGIRTHLSCGRNSRLD